MSNTTEPLQSAATDPHLTAMAIAGDTTSFPSHAELVRTMLAAGRFATLTTLTARDASGYPYGSLVAYSVLADGSPLLCISELAEHTRNAHADPRAGLLLTGLAVDAGSDPLDRPRTSLVGRLIPYTPTGAERDAHLALHPGAVEYAGFPDFGWWRLTIERARYVGGFGHMSWITGAEIAAAAVDTVLLGAQSAIDHMNADHADASLDMVRALAGVTAATSARVHAIDRHGITLYSEVPDSAALVSARVAFADGPLAGPADVRRAVVALAQAAAQAAGGAE